MTIKKTRVMATPRTMARPTRVASCGIWAGFPAGCDDDEYHVFYSSPFSPRLVPNRGAGESAGDDITATPGDRRNNDGRYEDLWSNWQDAGRDRGVPAEKGDEAP
jgi:hypothetical protein